MPRAVERPYPESSEFGHYEINNTRWANTLLLFESPGVHGPGHISGRGWGGEVGRAQFLRGKQITAGTLQVLWDWSVGIFQVTFQWLNLN